jgi:HK97 family phage portal protein
VKILGLDISWSRKQDSIELNALMNRLDAAYRTLSGVAVTPENCTEAPTVLAIVTAISRRIATLPVHVYKKTESDGRVSKELLPNHPVAKLLKKPNDWQTPSDYWLDATSCLVRFGNYYAFKGRGSTGPIRRLEPLCAGAVCVEQDDDMRVVYKVTQGKTGTPKEFSLGQIHHARGPSKDFLKGESPVNEVRQAIGLEIAAEQFGATFFGNGAMPFVVFEFGEKSRGFKNPEDRKQLVEDFQQLYSAKDRFRAMVAPPGLTMSDPIKVENDKAQFLETRKYQRSVIAGAFGVPPHLVGDLERGTFNNVEQQSLDFVLNVVLPYVRIFEAAMERDFLTDADRSSGICIRFNLEGALRADFKTRQEGLNIQRMAGVITPNEWREQEGMNPLPDGKGGDEIYQQGPSGQSGKPTGSPPAEPASEGDEGDDDEQA